MWTIEKSANDEFAVPYAVQVFVEYIWKNDSALARKFYYDGNEKVTRRDIEDLWEELPGDYQELFDRCIITSDYFKTVHAIDWIERIAEERA